MRDEQDNVVGPPGTGGPPTSGISRIPPRRPGDEPDDGQTKPTEPDEPDDGQTKPAEDPAPAPKPGRKPHRDR
jgi:hypothetical protein